MKPRTRRARKAAPRLPGYFQAIAFSKAVRRRRAKYKGDAASRFIQRAISQGKQHE